MAQLPPTAIPLRDPRLPQELKQPKLIQASLEPSPGQDLLFKQPETPNEQSASTSSQSIPSQTPSSGLFLPRSIPQFESPIAAPVAAPVEKGSASSDPRPNFTFSQAPTFMPPQPQNQNQTLQCSAVEPRESFTPQHSDFRPNLVPSPQSNTSIPSTTAPSSISTLTQSKTPSTIQPPKPIFHPDEPGSVSPRSMSPLTSFPDQPHQPIRSHQTNLPTAAQDDQPVSEHVITPQDREKAVETVSRLGLLQNDGLLQQYVDFSLPDMLKELFFLWEREKAESARRKSEVRPSDIIVI